MQHTGASQRPQTVLISTDKKKEVGGEREWEGREAVGRHARKAGAIITSVNQHTHSHKRDFGTHTHNISCKRRIHYAYAMLRV